MELTAREEDNLLEEARERYFEAKENQYFQEELEAESLKIGK
jgi:hypothetical protein